MIRLLQYFTSKNIAQKLHNLCNFTIPTVKEKIICENASHNIVCLDTRDQIYNPWYKMLAYTNTQYSYIFVHSESGVLATDTVATIIGRLFNEEQNIKALCINISSIYKTERLTKNTSTNCFTCSSLHTFFPYHSNSTNIFLHFYTLIKSITYIEALCKIYNVHLIWHCNTEIISTFVLKQFINKRNFVGKQIRNNDDKKIFALFNKKITTYL